jgi:hypothetical protein
MMIKKEWLSERNGFAPGSLVLYIDPTKETFSQVFRLKDLDAEEAFHPGADEGKRPLLKVHGKGSFEGAYGTDWFLEFDGDLYPLDSPLYALWHPSRPETWHYDIALIETPLNTDFGSSTQVIRYSTRGDFGRSRRDGAEYFERPDWADKAAK